MSGAALGSTMRLFSRFSRETLDGLPNLDSIGPRANQLGVSACLGKVDPGFPIKDMRRRNRA